MGEKDSTSPGEIETGIAGRACEACHKKKTKCDMQQPVCGLCRRTNKQCHFPSTRKRPSRQEPSVRSKLQKVNGNLDRLVELLETNPGLGNESLKGILGVRESTRRPSDESPNHWTGSASTSNPTLSNDHISPVHMVGTARSTPFPISYDLATHLIEVYFDKIQSWLPIFHKPTFLEYSADRLQLGHDTLSEVSYSEAIMFEAIFALSARFSNHPDLENVHNRDKGEKFMHASEYYFRIVRDAEEFDLAFLKACVLLAYYHYASGYSKRGWYITHMCIRGCYEMGLHTIDEGDAMDDSDEEWVEKESLRRIFWSIWEVDSFGSIVKRKPFAIDWRHIEVKMPVSDEAWFAGHKIESNKFVPGPDCWQTLVGSPNQDERAWSLLSKALVGHVFDLMLFKEGIPSEKITTAENCISCFKLAMPETLQLTSPSWTATGMPLARKNWVIATNLYLSAASFVLTRMPIIGQPLSPKDEAESKEMSMYSTRVAELNEILKRWPADSLPYAHPCLICTILTYDESLINMLPATAAVSAYRNLSGLILSKMAERWKIGLVLLRIRDLARDYNNSNEETRADLIRQYPIYFDRELKRNRKSITEEAQRTWTPSVHSPDDMHVHPRKSMELPLSPPQISQQVSSQQRQQHQQQQQVPQQQPTPPFNYGTAAPFDNMYDPSMNSNNNTEGNSGNFQSFSPFTSAQQAQSPEDIDAMLSGFLQEPWWQDFGAVNFVV